ncbi:helix-turn-helix domain-containing protein [Brevundimonas diminuta]|uniref:helix-turn-helix domain-containing protein n=1 Tax=Brevundimonas diminuta TaxID=293 RepID=UPI000FE1EB18|nr:helix-turn-helix domain-containing protein [Brevundimonas diminuta]MBU3994118.1 helix-turn-helix domain-containing protein [Alphaproteobacteria bacterium]
MSRQRLEQLRYLRTAEAAALLRLSPRTLEKYRVHGTGPAYRKAGGTVLYVVDELISWVESSRRGSTGDDQTHDC